MKRKLAETCSSTTYYPGAVDELNCGVCGTKMEVDRNKFGPTSSAMSMAKKKHGYDYFHCPHREEDWHKQVTGLRKEKDKTYSHVWQTLLEIEINEILDTQKPTIDMSGRD